MKYPVLKDPGLQDEFDRNGYVVVPFLTKEETDYLSAVYHELHPQLPPTDGLYASTHAADNDYRDRVSQEIYDVFTRHTDAYFHDCLPLGGSYVVKAPGGKGELPVHQDWSMVDESRFCSMQIWVPLIDVNEANGAVSVLDGSHRYIDTVRGPNVPSPYDRLHPQILARMKRLDMPAGHAFIYDHALLHYSPPNNTDKIRLATAFGVAPAAADVLFYYRSSDWPTGKIEIFKVDAQFYVRMDATKRPENAPSVGIIDYRPELMTESELIRHFAPYEAKAPESFMESLKAFLSGAKFRNTAY